MMTDDKKNTSYVVFPSSQASDSLTGFNERGAYQVNVSSASTVSDNYIRYFDATNSEVEAPVYAPVFTFESDQGSAGNVIFYKNLLSGTDSSDDLGNVLLASQNDSKDRIVFAAQANPSPSAFYHSARPHYVGSLIKPDISYQIDPYHHPALANRGLNVLKSAQHLPTKVPHNKTITVASLSRLGAMIKEAREELDMTQEELGDYAGVGRRFISELENGKKDTMHFGKVLKVCEAAGVDLKAEIR